MQSKQVKSAKTASKAASPRKPVPKKPVAKATPKAKKSPLKPASAKKSVPVKKPAVKPVVKKASISAKPAPSAKPASISNKKSALSDTFLKKQHARLLDLKDLLLDNVRGVNVEEVDKANAFGMHQADAGSDAYDRDFALTSLSHSHNSLREIDQALDRLAAGTYGTCENCGKPIPQARLEALPHTRYTVGCQSEIERDAKQQLPTQQPTVSVIWGLEEEENEEENEEEFSEEK